MSSLNAKLVTLLQQALEKSFGSEYKNADPLLRETQDKKFGDYQSNLAMSLAKKIGKNPREVAQSILDNLPQDDLIQSLQIAGPGFINISLSESSLAKSLQELLPDERLGVPQVANPVLHVVDFSSPNLAKEMHIGHLRATITGEVICRILEFQGYPVARTNHVGDWGTQFGMLIEYIMTNQPEVVKNPESFQVQDLEEFYKAAKKKFDEDPGFVERARLKVVALQSGDVLVRSLWKAFLRESLRCCHEIYQELGVTIQDLGESFYNDRLAGVVAEIEQRGFAKESQGALCAFLDGFTNREGEPLPFIIRKADGGYNYASTDLAAMQYRTQELGAKRIVIITDVRQVQHFQMLEQLSRKMGWLDDVRFTHIGYGMVLGQDKRPFKTRDGGTVRVKDVISEAVERARKVMDDSRFDSSVTQEEKNEISRRVGLAAIKYFDLSHGLSSDYVFNWDNMLAMEGNTGPYMLYAYARMMSLGRKSGLDFSNWKQAEITISHSTERDLSLAILKFQDLIVDLERELKPNLLTDYLYQLAKAFSAFYDKRQGVKILDAETAELKSSRLALCALTARTLKQGLSLLGIETVNQM